MFVERKRLDVPEMPFTASGTSRGLVTVANIRGLFTGQIVTIKGSSLPTIQVKIKRFISNTQFFVGDKDKPIEHRTDISAYLLANTPTVEAAEQPRPGITFEDRDRATYMEEPIAARRSILVDEFGSLFSQTNPIPVSLTNPNVEINVQLTHLDNFPNPGDIADSVRVGNGVNILNINADGSANVIQQNRIVTTKHDEITITRDVFDRISLVDFKVAGASQQLLTLTRNINGSIVNVKRTP